MTFNKLPPVLAFNRKLEPSDALMYSGCWNNLDNNASWQKITLFERHNRAVKSNFKPEVLKDDEALQKQIIEGNLAWGDDASLAHEDDTLKVSFSVRIIGGLEQPSVCNEADFERVFKEKMSDYLHSSNTELAQRYAYNIANGRFLWRNRVGAQNIKVCVSHDKLNQPLQFNAYDFSLNQTTADDEAIAILAQIIHAGLTGQENTLLTINAFVQLGVGQRIWPSQEMVLNGAKGEKSRHLFKINEQAAMHCEKIGNALRTIDDWYPEAKAPIAVEAYGSVTQRGVAYRPGKNDFKTLLLKWLQQGTASPEEQHFVVAMVIRGGVFGEGGDS